MHKLINNLYFLFLDLLFPKKCVACESYGEFICNKCFAEIKEIRTDTCFFCGKISEKSRVCQKCRRMTDARNIVASVSYESKAIRELIHNLKYSGVASISVLLSDFLVRRVKLGHFNFEGFIVVPVPSHKQREAKRGYNQAELIARHFSERVQLRGGVALEKVKDTKPQVSFDRAKRMKNIEGTISCNDRELIKENKILLIDDISTTGSTIGECAKVLKNSGAKEVWALIVAHA